jgi:hypothetical protein
MKLPSKTSYSMRNSASNNLFWSEMKIEQKVQKIIAAEIKERKSQHFHASREK